MKHSLNYCEYMDPLILTSPPPLTLPDFLTKQEKLAFIEKFRDEVQGFVRKDLKCSSSDTLIQLVILEQYGRFSWEVELVPALICPRCSLKKRPLAGSIFVDDSFDYGDSF